MTQLWSISYG